MPLYLVRVLGISKGNWIDSLYDSNIFYDFCIYWSDLYRVYSSSHLLHPIEARFLFYNFSIHISSLPCNHCRNRNHLHRRHIDWLECNTFFRRCNSLPWLKWNMVKVNMISLMIQKVSKNWFNDIVIFMLAFLIEGGATIWMFFFISICAKFDVSLWACRTCGTIPACMHETSTRSVM